MGIKLEHITSKKIGECLKKILPDDEFPIFVITILNGFQSDVIVNKLLDVIDKCKNGK